jgi:hypothetical protein
MKDLERTFLTKKEFFSLKMKLSVNHNHETSNLKQKTRNKEQKTKNKKQRTKNKEQGTNQHALKITMTHNGNNQPKRK